MEPLERALINHYQGDFPITDRPFQLLAEQFKVSESEVMSCIQSMLDSGLLTRFGPLYNIDRMGGQFSLCAMQVPSEVFDEIAAKVNRFPEVAHNYARDHLLNMWFVAAAESAAQLTDLIERIERETGLKVYNFPKQHEFYVNFQPRA